MNTMTTYSGRKFDPMQMTPGDVYIEDIAHALSLLCRGGGQLTYFYSVGQHSLNCAAEAKARGWSKRQQLACLLHDASEGYISLAGIMEQTGELLPLRPPSGFRFRSTVERMLSHRIKIGQLSTAPAQ